MSQEVFERFTQRSRRVFDVAQREVENRYQTHIEPAHVLMALFKEDDGQATKILKRLNADVRLMQSKLDRDIGFSQADTSQAVTLTESTNRVIRYAVEEARSLGAHYLGTEHLLLGLLRENDPITRPIFESEKLSLAVVRAQAIALTPQSPPDMSPIPPLPVSPETPIVTDDSFRLSPIFLLLLLLTAGAGYLTYDPSLLPMVPVGISLFVFVTGGWIVSVALHEFGHALVAYLGGDKSVAAQGYLTLNPLKYTHGVTSILFPVIFLLMGGIGLPGGAVYVNHQAIPNRLVQSLVSLAGPAASALCAVVLVIPFIIGVDQASLEAHFPFWAGLTFLAFLQITAVFLNLLPIPPLDGFNILRPFLPESVLSMVNQLGMFTFLIILFVFMSDNIVTRNFWGGIFALSQLANLDSELVRQGFSMYQFWRN